MSEPLGRVKGSAADCKRRSLSSAVGWCNREVWCLCQITRRPDPPKQIFRSAYRPASSSHFQDANHPPHKDWSDYGAEILQRNFVQDFS